MSSPPAALSGVAFERRRRDFPNAPSSIVRNYAVARLHNGRIVIGRSRGAGRHAEAEVLQQVSALPGKPQIAELYSERQPCCTCEAALAAAEVSPQSITYSAEFFDMPGSPSAEDTAELARLNNGCFEELRQMIRRAERRQQYPGLSGPFAETTRKLTALLSEQGLNVVAEPDRGHEPGVEIATDDLADEGCGVYLSWYVGTDLIERILDAVQSDQLNDSALAEAAAIKQFRLVELVTILDKAGVRAIPFNDDTAPFTLKITVNE